MNPTKHRIVTTIVSVVAPVVGRVVEDYLYTSRYIATLYLGHDTLIEEHVFSDEGAAIKWLDHMHNVWVKRCKDITLATLEMQS